MSLRSIRVALIGVSVAATAMAQTDTTSIATRTRGNPADTVRSPITPKRAFLLSLFAPGSAQNVLGRNRAAAGIVAVEAISIGMLRESGADLAEARRQTGDSLILSYVDANGDRLATPLVERRRFAGEEVRSRRSHVEDWIALLIANHLFAAADAFVAASLWDVKAHITLQRDNGRLLLGSRITW